MKIIRDLKKHLKSRRLTQKGINVEVNVCLRNRLPVRKSSEEILLALLRATIYRGLYMFREACC
ncbi:MAG: hypothetical protein LBS15_03425 [Endomicrobium sp.]|jgi:hypothetical protein|nr:hypothetical protein [Endomicrobium sp.]